ncbi:MAG: methyltransferase domain-containing protein [Gammaproteobacteria bacterium]|jgi:ubiquinone/menaquinone biosynthesis C-methylase UbiE|nr:methyltransferase domain-containing protein [Gammaproteobacteria bacterium]NBD95401.1 methyltransferase domain-containing protein [Gammaproteobacteria bacterium]
MGVKEAYDRWARLYDDNDNRTRDLNRQCLRQAGLPLTGGRVFEAGCGTGLNTEYLAGHADHVVAMDFSEGMLERARRRVESSSVRFESGDITQAWPVEDASCDLVVITLVLEHIDNLGRVLAQARRVLNGNGLLYVAELHPYRQLIGKQARFTPEGSEREELVPTWRHSISEYVSSAMGVGLVLRGMAEPRAEGDEVPRLLQLWMSPSFKPDA